MEMWLFFTIFGLVLFVPSLILVILYNRFKNTIVVMIKRNGALHKIVINDKILELGQITKDNGKPIKPIKVSKTEIYYGKWRRFIIKPELESTEKQNITDKEVEDYLNNEDLLKLYLAGKFKETLIILIYIIIGAVVVAGVINGYLTSTKECIIVPTNETTEYLKYIVRDVFYNMTG